MLMFFVIYYQASIFVFDLIGHYPVLSEDVNAKTSRLVNFIGQFYLHGGNTAAANGSKAPE